MAQGLAIDVAAWSSPWRHRSPGDKLLLAVGLVVCALVLPVWPGSVVVTIVAAGLCVGPAAVPWRVLLVAARGALVFILLGALGIALVWDGATGLTVTGASLARAASTAAHAVAGTASMLLLAATTPICDLLGWLRRRGLPEAVTDIAGIVYRLLFVLLTTTRSVRAAQAARLGYATRRAALRSAAALTAAVLTRSLSRARALEEGLAGRGLDGPLRVLYDERPSSGRFVACSVAVLAGVVTVSVALGP